MECPVCRASFTPARRNQKYCSRQCRIDNQNRKAAERDRAVRAATKPLAKSQKQLKSAPIDKVEQKRLEKANRKVKALLAKGSKEKLLAYADLLMTPAATAMTLGIPIHKLDLDAAKLGLSIHRYLDSEHEKNVRQDKAIKARVTDPNPGVPESGLGLPSPRLYEAFKKAGNE